MVPSDEVRELVESATIGNEKAIEFLLEDNLPLLRAFVRLRLGKELRVKESHSDIAQSVCREVLEGMKPFEWRGEVAFRGWLFTVAARKIADRLEHYQAKKRDVRRELNQSARDNSAVWECYERLDSPVDQAIAKEQAERIERGFDQLSEEQREIIVLARVVGMSRGEIAKKLGKSDMAVRQALHRGLAKLTSFLQGT